MLFARGHVLHYALSTGIIGPEQALELIPMLHAEGISENQIRRVARTALPAGLGAVARRGLYLRAEAALHGEGDATVAMRAKIVSEGPYRRLAIPPPDYSPELQAVVRERMLWASILHEVLPSTRQDEENKIATQSFFAEHFSGLYFLLRPGGVVVTERMYFSPSQTLRLIGALDSIVQDWGPSEEASTRFGKDLAALDLASPKDIAYAKAFVDVLREYSRYPRALGGGGITPEIGPHLAKLLVDDSFVHRVDWIGKDASSEERKKWWSNSRAANEHSSLQFAAGEVLKKMDRGAHGAEAVLISFIDKLIDDLEIATADDANRLRSQHGKDSALYAVAVLLRIDTPASKEAIQRLRKIGEDKLSAFAGVLREINSAKPSLQ